MTAPPRSALALLVATSLALACATSPAPLPPPPSSEPLPLPSAEIATRTPPDVGPIPDAGSILDAGPIPNAGPTPDAGPPANPCAGHHVDLNRAGYQTACTEGPQSAPATDLSALELRLDPPSTRLAPGATALLRLTLKNRGAAPLVLLLRHGLGVRTLQVRAASGALFAPPPGEPKWVRGPAKICAIADCYMPTDFTVTLAAGGDAFADVPWTADRTAWPPGVTEIACCGDPPPPILTGALAAGVYHLALSPLFRESGSGPAAKGTIEIAR